MASDHVAGWMFVLPSVLLIVLFGLIPVVWGFVLSLQKAGLISPIRPFIGLSNYEQIASDPLARTAAVNAAYYTFLFVPISIVLALFLAIALNQKIRLIRFYRLAVFIPVAVSTIATGIMFLWLFDKEFGLANLLLGKVGLGPFGFFDSPQGAMPSLVVMTVWGWLGFDTIVYLAALQGRAGRADRGRRRRRRRALDAVPERGAAPAGTGDAAAGGLVDDQRAAAVRRGVLRDEGRPAGTGRRAGLLHLSGSRSPARTGSRGRIRGRDRPTSCSW